MNESLFAKFTPEEITIWSFSIALALAEQLTLDDLRVLGNIMGGMAEVMLLIAAQRALLDAQKTQQKSNSIQNLQAQIQDLQSQIDQLKQRLGNS